MCHRIRRFPCFPLAGALLVLATSCATTPTELSTITVTSGPSPDPHPVLAAYAPWKPAFLESIDTYDLVAYLPTSSGFQAYGVFPPSPIDGGEITYSSSSSEKDATHSWNIFATEGANRITPVISPQNAALVLEPDKDYTVALTLTLAPDDAPGVMSRVVSVAAKERIAESIDSDDVAMDVTPFVIVDADYFHHLDEQPEVLRIDVAALRAAITRPSATIEADELKERLSLGAFASIRFNVSTRSRLGAGTVAIILWDDLEPIDEIAVRFCIAEGANPPCDGHELPPSESKGTFLVGLQDLSDARDAMAAGVHIATIDKRLIGVMRYLKDNGEVDSVEWVVTNNAAALQHYIETLQTKQYLSPNDGTALYNYLFPEKAKGGKEARRAIEAVLAQNQSGVAFDPSRPTLSFRYLSHDEWPLIIPIGLMRTPKVKHDVEANELGITIHEYEDPIGYHFRVVHSLPSKVRSETQKCISTWTPVIELDSATSTMQQAYRELNSFGTMVKYNPVDGSRTFSPWEGASIPIINRLPEQLQSAMKEDSFRSDALILLGHYGNGRFSFTSAPLTDPTMAYLEEGLISTQFRSPSLGILAMCSSADPGWNSLAQRLKSQGMESMVLTNTTISGKLGGAFIGCFMGAVAQSGGRITLGEAFARAESCLYINHGLRAEILSLSLVGDPDTELCIE